MASTLDRFRAKRRGETVVVEVESGALKKVLAKVDEAPETYGPPSVDLSHRAETALSEKENHVGGVAATTCNEASCCLTRAGHR